MRTINQALTRLFAFLCLAALSFGGGSSVFAYTNPFANTSVNVNTTNHTATVTNLPQNSGERFNLSSLPSGTYTTVDVSLVGDGSAGHPFEIGTVDQWNAFAFIVNDVSNMNTACAILTADITFTNNHSQPGLQGETNSNNIPGRRGTICYCGTFDGQGHTITLNFNEYKENGVLAGGTRPESSYGLSNNTIGTWGGLFFYVGSATIKNLHVTGTVRSKFAKCGTIAHNISGTCSLINCQSTVELISVNGSAAFGGLVGQENRHLNISNCFVNGKLSIAVSDITSNQYYGGCVGLCEIGNALYISNTYVQPQDIQETGTNSGSYHAYFYPFSYSSSSYNPTVTNSYYKLPSGFNVGHLSTTTAQGTDKEAPSTVDATVTALNTDLSTAAWEAHNDTVYLKTFAKYVDIDSWTYGSPNTPTIVGNNGNGAVTYQYKVQGAADNTYATYTPGTTVLGVGNYTLKASVAANGGWNAWESTMDFTVSAAAGAISAAPTAASLTYNGDEQALLATNGEATGTFYYREGTSGEWSTTPPTKKLATTYHVYYYISPDGNHTADNLGSSSSPLGPVDVTIEPKAVTVSGITASNKTYDGNTTATLAYTNATFAGKVGSDILSVSATGQFASKDVGTGKTVTISTLVLAGASAGNYTIASSSQSTTTANITPKPLTITGITASNKTYDGSTTATVNGTGAIIDGLIPGDDLTLTYTGAFDNANVGTGKVVTVNAYISGGASAGNYQVAGCNSPTADIAPKALTVTANPKTITYGDAPANAGVTYSGFVTDEDENTAGVLSGTLAYAYTYAQYGDVGSYTITPSGLTSNNYAITFESGTLTVQQKALTITAKDQAITYGTTIATGTGQVTAEGLVTGDVLTTVTLTPSASDYTTNGTITPSDATTQKGIGNYSVTYTDGALTIGKAVLTVTAKDKTITYGDAPANDGVTYSGFVTGEDENTAGVLSGTLAYAYTYAQYGDVGSYTITPSGLTSNNYAITFESGTLTVQQKALTITAKDQAITYGTTIATGTGQVTAEGLVTGDVLTTVTLTPSASDYTTNGTITPSDATTQKGIGNYSVTYTDGALTIGKAVLTVTAKDKTITYGDAPANDGVTYSGFVTGEDENTVGVLGGTLAYTYSYAQYGDVGNAYTITPSGLTSSNYAITFTPGTLTVEPKEVGLEWSTTTTFEYDGEEHAPTATATDLINGDEVGVTVTGAQTDACEEGYVANATALTGDKSGNYKLPTDVSQNFIINRKEVGISWGHTLLTYNGSAQAPIAQATGLVGADECNLTVDGGQTAVGAYTATVTGMTGSSKDNYKLPTAGLSTDYEIVNPLSISFAANQMWATWYGDYDYEVPEGTTAYTVSSVSGSTVTVDGITYIPANTGVLIKRETTGTATVANSNVYYEETCDYTSLLKSGDPTPYQDYILYGNEFVLSSVSAIGEHRCYLPGTGAASARRLTIEMGEAPTGISPRTVGETDSGEWYDLQGRRIGKPQGKGLYIRDGRKVVIK